MAETQLINQLKFRITSLESQLHDKQKQVEEYQTIESEADSKIKALNKIHGDKVKNLLNSIQILKKEKASIEGLSKEHKRSKLIEQLNKEILDQDIAIEVLRKHVYDEKGKEKGRQVCDEMIVKALTKGPERIRPLSREELRMEIDKLKSININLEHKIKMGSSGREAGNTRSPENDDLSIVSQLSEQSFINQNEGILKKMRDLQFENENMKLQVNAKLKIIEQMKTDLQGKQKLKIETEIYRSELDVANKKVATLEKLMKETKEHTNAKIVELYEREIKVEELEMVSKQNRDQLLQAQQGHNILSEEMRLQREQLEAEIEALKAENEQIILENSSGKKHLGEMKKIFKDMEDINVRQKEELKDKLNNFEKQVQRLLADNKKYTEAYRNVENTLFTERAQWVDEKSKLVEQLRGVRENVSNKQLIGKYMQDIDDLRQENLKLKKMLEAGGSGGDDHVLLQRLEGYKRKLQFYESKGDKSKQKLLYDELFSKYNNLMQQFDEYRRKHQPRKAGAKRKHYIDITAKQQSEYDHMSSGISKLNLGEVDSEILDNFDSSYQFEFVLNEFGEKVRMPKITEADKELLKLMTSDLWGFVEDGNQEMSQKIQEGASYEMVDLDESDKPEIDYRKMRQLKNVSNPRGQKIVVYEQEINKLNQISDSISVTSALDKELKKYDSDIDIEMRKLPQGAPRDLNICKLDDLSISVGDVSQISSVKDGESNLGKRKKKLGDKGSRILPIGKRGSDKSISEIDVGESSMGSSCLDSDVSSVGVGESQLAAMDSDIEPNFHKKKK